MAKEPTTATILPFRIDRSLRLPLTRQLVEGFRRAISSGVYGPGKMLPSISTLVKMTGVCPVVVRNAIKRLAAEGLVKTHPGVGSEVLDVGKEYWKGHVALITAGISDNYTVAQFVGRVTITLMRAGYLVSKITIRPNGSDSEQPSPGLLLPSGTMFAVVLGLFLPEMRKALSLARVPFIVVSGKTERLPLCRGFIPLDNLHALPDFIEHCKERRVGTVAQFSFFVPTPAVRDAVVGAGMEYVALTVPWEMNDGRYSNAVEMAMAYMDMRLEKMAGRLPDVILCTDNCAAEGALLSLVKHNVRIPEDVGFVTWMPKGDRPVFWKSLTRLETDPVKCGDELGRIVLRLLEGRPLPPGTAFRSVYKVGETFPHPFRY